MKLVSLPAERAQNTLDRKKQNKNRTKKKNGKCEEALYKGFKFRRVTKLKRWQKIPLGADSYQRVSS